MGGQGRRMGYVDKGQIGYEGRTFLERIREELGALNLPFVLSTADREDLTGDDGVVYVKDILKLTDGRGAGPMGGIWSCFQKTGAEGFFVVSCDMPLFRKEMFQLLMKRIQPEYDGVLWRTRDGRIQPLCGFYSRSCLVEMTKAVEEGNYRMMEFLSKRNCLIVDTSSEHIPDSWFINVNSQEVLEKLRNRKTPVLAVSGRKNTGKTTLLEGLVETLSSSGIRAAVIKHDGHEFDADVPGTDSWRMKKAGAYASAVYSGTKFSLVKEKEGLEAEDLFQYVPEADIILLEGQKHSEFLKLETVRKDISSVPVCRPDTVLAYVSEGVLSLPGPVYGFQDRDGLSELIVEVLDGHF